MRHSLFEETVAERRMLCMFALACYSTTVSSLAALAYGICVWTFDSAGFQINVIYRQFGG